MPKGLKRYYGAGDLHYITCSCYRRRPLLASARRRDLFLRILEEVRRQYDFVVVGYVVMPEHFHLLISEPERGDPSKIMQVLKQRLSRRLRRRRKARPGQGSLWDEPAPAPHFWQRRFYDFNVWSKRKRVEKLRYLHRNPVRRGLVTSPELWRWSSFRFYALGEAGPVAVNQGWRTELRFRAPAA
ncbi:MAG TPA: transposase [Terriglobales bacterium]|nr:transposase [Terriglobales bacterium]